MNNANILAGGRFSSQNDIVKGLHPFDAHKVILTLKINATKEKIVKLNEAYKSKKGVRIISKLKVEVAKMIDNIKEDRKKMLKIHEKNLKHNKLVKRFPIFKKNAFSDEELENQERDLELITRYIIELELLSKIRYRRHESKEKLFYQNYGTSTSQAEEEDDHFKSIRNKLILSQDIGEDMNLPELDISYPMKIIKESNTLLDQHLDTFNKRLKHLHEQSLSIGSELDEQSILLSDINNKAERRNEQIELLNKRLEKCLNHVNSTQKLICISCLLCCILIFAVASLVIISTGENWGWIIPKVE